MLQKRCHLVLLWLTLLCIVEPACTDDPTAIRVRFVAESALNTEAQVMSVIDRIEVVVAAVDGFEIAPGLHGTWHAADLDGDQAIDLVLSRPVLAGAQRFPLFRLRPGGQQQAAEVDLWARGLVGPEVAAVGERTSAGFRAGHSEEAALPLNLRSRFRPPRVLLTLPHAGQAGVPSALGRIYLEFSKWISPASVANNLVVVYASSQGDRRLGGNWQLSHTSVQEHGLPEERTIATLDLGDCSLNPGEYRVEAKTGITDVSGNPLDQDATKPGSSGFLASFWVAGQPQADPCSTRIACRDNGECDPTGSGAFVCIKDDADSVTGRCLPLPGSCNTINCPTGYVCSWSQPTGGAAGSASDVGGTCVRDCRIDASVCAATTFCDSGSGLCASDSTTCTDNNCDDSSSDPACINGVCTPAGTDPGCSNDDPSCADGAPCPAGSGCDLPSGNCVLCTTSEGCCAPDGGASSATNGCLDPGFYCDPSTGQCLSRSEGSTPGA